MNKVFKSESPDDGGDRWGLGKEVSVTPLNQGKTLQRRLFWKQINTTGDPPSVTKEDNSQLKENALEFHFKSIFKEQWSSIRESYCTYDNVRNAAQMSTELAVLLLVKNVIHLSLALTYRTEMHSVFKRLWKYGYWLFHKYYIFFFSLKIWVYFNVP